MVSHIIRVKASTEPANPTHTIKTLSFGLNEEMPADVQHYPNGTSNWLLMHFHTPVGIQVQGQWTELEAGTFYAWPPHTPQHYGSYKQSWRHSWIQATGDVIEEILSDNGFSAEHPSTISDHYLTEKHLLRLFEEHSSHEPPNDALLNHSFQCWLIELGRASKRNQTPSAQENLRRLKLYLDGHLEQRITLQDMSRIAGMSIPHLSALFQEYYDSSPVAYHIERRIDLAKFMLGDRKFTVSETATRLGYSDIFSFSRAFKRTSGISPSEWRQQREAD